MLLTNRRPGYRIRA